MASYRVLYWKDIPSVIEATEGGEDVKLTLGNRFEDMVDAKATELGLVGTDDYLQQWHYGDESERPGSAREVAEAVKRELEAEFS